LDAVFNPRDDRSIGPLGGASLSRHARRFLLVSVSLLVSACSSLQLGYNNADTLLAYAVDSYFDLDDEQMQMARERIAALHGWHRSTQLAGYAQLLRGAQAKLRGSVDAADVLAFNEAVNAQLLALGERAADDLAALALTLKPAQLAHLSDKLAKDSSKARRELVSFAGPESIERRLERSIERAESWFGSVSDLQREELRAALAAQPAAHEWWHAEREQRQRDLVAVLVRISSEQPEPAVAGAWLRAYFADLARPAEPQRRERLESFRRGSAELTARLIATASGQQRQYALQRLQGYASDLDTLAAAAR
jgi:hypothetical protein